MREVDGGWWHSWVNRACFSVQLTVSSMPLKPTRCAQCVLEQLPVVRQAFSTCLGLRRGWKARD